MNSQEFCFLAVAGCVIAWGAQHWLTTPEVHRSWETKECVQVLPASAGSCENHPDRYVITWTR